MAMGVAPLQREVLAPSRTPSALPRLPRCRLPAHRVAAHVRRADTAAAARPTAANCPTSTARPSAAAAALRCSPVPAPSSVGHQQRQQQPQQQPQPRQLPLAEAGPAGEPLGRRAVLAAWLCSAVGVAAAGLAAPPSARAAVNLTTIQEEAFLAYGERRFQDAVDRLTELVAAEPQQPRWLQMRAEALVDGKNFPGAMKDFDAALAMTPDADWTTRARLLAGRALAAEGLGEWASALGDYRAGMELAAQAGETPDPYILNSMGNCLNSLGRWQEAREQYLASSEGFQQARGFRGRNGSTTPRLDGAIFAASNAALMRAQLGDMDGAVQEMVRIARRAPGSADMRAALAALYWEQGRRVEAEESWEYACERITVGCTKYTDLDWLGRIRRWPPAMVARMADFLALKPSGSAV